MSKRKGEDNSQDQNKRKRQRTDYKPKSQALVDSKSDPDEIDKKGDEEQESKGQKLDSAPEEPEVDDRGAGGSGHDAKSGSESGSESDIEDEGFEITFTYKGQKITAKDIEPDQGWIYLIPKIHKHLQGLCTSKLASCFAISLQTKSNHLALTHTPHKDPTNLVKSGINDLEEISREKVIKMVVGFDKKCYEVEVLGIEDSKASKNETEAEILTPIKGIKKLCENPEEIPDYENRLKALGELARKFREKGIKVEVINLPNSSFFIGRNGKVRTDIPSAKMMEEAEFDSEKSEQEEDSVSPGNSPKATEKSSLQKNQKSTLGK